MLISIAFFVFHPAGAYGGEWQEIEKKGLLTIAVKDNLRPLGYRDQEGNLRGFEIDLAHRLALELLGEEKAVQLIPVNNQERIQIVTDVEVDLAIASVTANASRRRIVDFSDSYYLDGTGILVKKGKKIDLTKKIGVLSNSRSIDQIRYNLPRVTLQAVSSYEKALELMELGEIEGFAGDITVLVGWVQENSDYELLSKVFGGYPLSIVLPKGRQYQELRDKVNQVIRKLNQEGWLEEKAKYWGLPINNLN
ncbi:transporter substrate-binding domain-containing protein [Geminocystis sp. NIES-3709]|uniref:transporter substrate-binding domain-containing protein n=1 Tax=Geminocystis sp. NIES-3709 TaxID=1617448 RepID=UPI0005FCC349|nr:transporter substrate-binding domain-containing protein [Geminocystis sp. NIES-3709]BAQ66578.1 ABC-type amino acid transport/signal transduction systems [Geminocystis sp. NIES-3709]